MGADGTELPTSLRILHYQDRLAFCQNGFPRSPPRFRVQIRGSNSVEAVSFRRIVDTLRFTPLHPQWLLGSRKRIEQRISALDRGIILDIGCAGRWVEKKLAAGCHYVGLDYPETGVLLYGARPDVFADAATLPIRDGCIDAVVMIEVIEHLRQPSPAMKEVFRVLRPGGQLLLSMPFLYPIHDAPHDYQRFTAHGLVRELEAAGLSVESVSPDLSAARSAGLIVCLALAGIASEALRKRNLALLLIPILALAVPIVNLTAWFASSILPSWPALTSGYIASARKP